MEILGFVAIPSIIIICFLMAEIYKVITKNKNNEMIPVLVGLCGGVLGALSFVLLVDYLPAENILEGVSIGIVSGFASTGINELKEQVFKRRV